MDTQTPRSRGSFLRYLLDDIERDFSSPSNVVTGPGGAVEPRLAAFGRIVGEALRLLRTESFESLENDIRDQALRMLGLDPIRDREYLDLRFLPMTALEFYRSLELFALDQGIEVPARLLGEGGRNAIVLGLMKAFEQRRKHGALLLVEEPEMYLHPQRQRYVYRLLRSIADENQVIYTTHSPHFVAIPDYADVVLVDRGAATGTRARRSNMPATTALVERLRKEMDPERAELFFATRTLLVEGDSEKLSLPVYATRLGIDLDAAGATVVEVGGKRNLKPMAELCRSFGIPTGMIYDEDSSDFSDKLAEAAYNAELDALASGEHSRVWRIPGNYEEELRRTLGSELFDRLSSSGEPSGKPARARRLAAATTTPIPSVLAAALRWVGDVKD